MNLAEEYVILREIFFHKGIPLYHMFLIDF